MGKKKKKEKRKTVKIVLNGELQEFEVDKSGKIFQNEDLFTSDFVEAVRRLRRWPRKGEELSVTSTGAPCFKQYDEPIDMGSKVE